MAKDKFITMRIDKVTLEKLKEIAEREHRTLTNLVSLIMINYVEANAKAKR